MSSRFSSVGDWVYDQFISKVADSRKIDRPVAEEIAQGRGVVRQRTLKLGWWTNSAGFPRPSNCRGKSEAGRQLPVAEYPDGNSLQRRSAKPWRPRRDQSFGARSGC